MSGAPRFAAPALPGAAPIGVPSDSIEMLADSAVIPLDDLEERAEPVSTDDGWGRPRVETVESPQDRRHAGTDASFLAPQYTPTDVGGGPGRTTAPRWWFLGSMIPAAAVVVAVLMGTRPGASEASTVASTEASTEASEPPEPPVLDEGLRALALVNVRDPARAQPFEQRHALLDRLSRGPDAKLVDLRLNRALDLLQAGDSPTPCRTFEQALGEMEAEPDPSYRETLEQARAPELSCMDLEHRREALLERLRPAAEASRDRSSGRRARRGRGRARRPATEPAEPSPPSPATDEGVGDKLDDGLRPFGK